MPNHQNLVSSWKTVDQIIADAEPGDLLECDRGTYQHWVVYVGNGTVAHLADPSFTQRSSALITTVRAEVVLDGLIDVAKDDRCRINNHYDNRFTPMSSERVVERALTAQGPQHYSLRSLNCEHFATWCRYDQFISKQVEEAGAWAKIVGVTLAGGVIAAGAMAVIHRIRQSS